jgi:membrane-associated protease RseP (regulator of RpoE activity)
MNNEGFREIHLHREPPFKGFGFHLQYNQTYYMVQDVTRNSPAEHAGLRANDIIRKVNNQPMDNMPHLVLVQIIDSNQEVTVLVQDHEAFFRANPQAPHHPIGPTMSNPSVSTNKNDGNKSENIFSRAFSKISKR